MTGSIWWLVLSAAIFVSGFGVIWLAFARVDWPKRRKDSVLKGDRGAAEK